MLRIAHGFPPGRCVHSAADREEKRDHLGAQIQKRSHRATILVYLMMREPRSYGYPLLKGEAKELPRGSQPHDSCGSLNFTHPDLPWQRKIRRETEGVDLWWQDLFSFRFPSQFSLLESEPQHGRVWKFGICHYLPTWQCWCGKNQTQRCHVFTPKWNNQASLLNLGNIWKPPNWLEIKVGI